MTLPLRVRKGYARGQERLVAKQRAWRPVDRVGPGRSDRRPSTPGPAGPWCSRGRAVDWSRTARCMNNPSARGRTDCPPLACSVRGCGLPLTRRAGGVVCPRGTCVRHGAQRLLEPAAASRSPIAARRRLAGGRRSPCPFAGVGRPPHGCRGVRAAGRRGLDLGWRSHRSSIWAAGRATRGRARSNRVTSTASASTVDHGGRARRETVSHADLGRCQRRPALAAPRPARRSRPVAARQT